MNEINIESFLGGISKEDFLKNYWNKKPLLIKSAYPNAGKLASKEDLIDFSMDEDFESRIIYEKQGNYTVKDGPLVPRDLKGKYTIACHALNLFNDDFKFFEELVTEMIPHWQFDDVMATVSSTGASVGAHTDHYGVFILQGAGSREWFIQENPTQDFREDLEVKILKEFSADYSWILNPGDMIYVPPLCGHHGVTIEDSISYSIGFKALEAQNIIKDYLYDLGQNFDDDDFYQNDKLKSKFELDDEFVDYFYNKIVNQLNDKNMFKSWLASFLSSSRYSAQVDEYSSKDDEYEIAYDYKLVHYKESESNLVYLNNKIINLKDDELNQLISCLKHKSLTKAKNKPLRDFLKQSAAFVLK